MNQYNTNTKNLPQVDKPSLWNSSLINKMQQPYRFYLHPSCIYHSILEFTACVYTFTYFFYISHGNRYSSWNNFNMSLKITPNLH